MCTGLDEEGLFGELVPVVDDVVQVGAAFAAEVGEALDGVGAGCFFEGVEIRGRVFGVEDNIR